MATAYESSSEDQEEARKTSRVGRLRIWLREPGSINKVENQLRMIGSYRLPHAHPSIHVCIHTYTRTCIHTWIPHMWEPEKEKKYRSIWFGLSLECEAAGQERVVGMESSYTDVTGKGPVLCRCGAESLRTPASRKGTLGELLLCVFLLSQPPLRDSSLLQCGQSGTCFFHTAFAVRNHEVVMTEQRLVISSILGLRLYKLSRVLVTSIRTHYQQEVRQEDSSE